MNLDVFFRPLLARAVKRCATRQEAREVRQLFCGNFNDCAVKQASRFRFYNHS